MAVTQIKIGSGGSFAPVALTSDGMASDTDTQLATLSPDDLPVALEAINSWQNAFVNGDTEGQALAQADANSVNVFIETA